MKIIIPNTSGTPIKWLWDRGWVASLWGKKLGVYFIQYHKRIIK